MSRLDQVVGLGTSGMTLAEGPRQVPAPVDVARDPGMNPFLRTPLPPINAAPDTLRQFYTPGVPQVRVIPPASSSNSYSSITHVTQQSIPTLDGIVDGQRFGKVSKGLTQYLDENGRLTASTPLNSQGSIVPNQAILFSYSYTNASITITWSSQPLARADGGAATLQAGTITYSGLSASTTYFMYPYICVADSKLYFTNPSPPSTSQNATYSLQTGADGRVPVRMVSVTTAATSGGTGGGTGGGSDTCPEATEIVDVEGKGQIPVSAVDIGDRILGKSFTSNTDVYRAVLSKTAVPCSAWRVVNGHRISPCEAVWYNDCWMPAFRVPDATLDTTMSTKVQLTVDGDQHDESNFYLVSGTRQLIHNFNMPVC